MIVLTPSCMIDRSLHFTHGSVAPLLESKYVLISTYSGALNFSTLFCQTVSIFALYTVLYM